MILISIAIAAGVVFLLVLLGILWALFARRDNNKIDYIAYEDEEESEHHRPSSLLEHINAATRDTILGTSPFENSKLKAEEAGGVGVSGDPFLAHDQDDDNFRRADTPSDVNGGAGMSQGRIAHARYSFDAGGEGELQISEGTSLEILDDHDPKYVMLFLLVYRLSC